MLFIDRIYRLIPSLGSCRYGNGLKHFCNHFCATKYHVRSIYIYFFLSSLYLLISCREKSAEGLVVVTESFGSLHKSESVSIDSLRSADRLRLVLIDPENRHKPAVRLTDNFWSACSPDVSYDGRYILFTGRLKKEDPWQIWEMKLSNHKARQITGTPDNSVDPAYLPGDRIVFSRSVDHDTLKAGHSLYTCSIYGKDMRRITFNPQDYLASTVLKDGRIITFCRQLYPAISNPVIMVIRPDGTKAELFYKSPVGHALKSKARETDDGRILFTESCDTLHQAGKPLAIHYNRPLHTRRELAPMGNYVYICPVHSGRMFVSYWSEDQGRFALFEFDDEKMIPGNQLYASGEGNVVEAIMVKVHERPRKLPSEVDMGVKTGLLLCQNINLTGMTSPESDFSSGLADHVEVLGIQSSLGKVKVRSDGSVYLKMPADMPFRIQTLDSAGHVVNGPGAWYYLRPNERRGCVGCHEDGEITPANRYAIAVRHKPVTIPVHMDGMKEKEVELE